MSFEIKSLRVSHLNLDLTLLALAAKAQIELSLEVQNTSIGHQRLSQMFSLTESKATLGPIADIVIQMMQKWSQNKA